MSNKQTTWELKAVDNLSEVIVRMEQMIKLQQQQAALSSTASRDIQIQMNGVASSYKSVETAIDKATTASKEQASETANVKAKFDALKTTVTPLTTIISNVYAGAKSKEFITDITQVDSRVNVLSKSFNEIISDVQKYSNEAKTAFAQVKAATDGARITDVTYQQQIEGRVVSTLDKIGKIQVRMQELAAKQSELANKEQAETAQLIQQKEAIIAKIDKINLTYGSLGARTEKQQDQWDAALRKTYGELDKVEGKIEQMPNKTAAENAKLEKQFDSLTTQVKGAVSSLVSAENQLEKLGVESQKSEGYIGKLRAEVDRLKELRSFAKTEEEVRALNVELNKAETNLQEIEGGGKKITDSFSSIKGTLAEFIGIYELISAVKAIFDLTTQWEKYEAVLKTALGSQEQASRSLEMLQGFADKTNFTLDELADTFIKFANRGLIVTQTELAKVGDVANALGKPFKDLGEAILDINNTERWNELGIKAKTAGDKVSLTFKGVTIEVEKSEQGVLRAVTAFGTLNGVQGQTDEIAKTLGGRMSTLSDGVAGLGRAIGEGLTPIFGGFIDASSQIVNWLTQQFTATSALTPVFNLLGSTLSVVWGYFAQLGEKLNEMTGGVFPLLFDWLTSNSNAMKLFATIVQVAIVGPFQLMVMGFQEIYQASQLVWNGFQGLIAGLQAVKAAMTLDFTGAKASIDTASDYFTKAGTNFSNMGAIYTKTNADFTNSLKAIWADAQTVAVAVDDTNKKLNAEQLKAVAAENDRWKKVSANMKEGTGEYAQAYADHLLKLQEADGTHTKAVVTAEKQKNKERKEQAVFSASEIAVLTKEIQEASLKDQLDLVDAKMKVEIEKINAHKVDYVKTEEDAALAIEAVIIKANREKEALIEESRVKITAGQIDFVRQSVEIETDLSLSVQAEEVQRLLNTKQTEEQKQAAKLNTLEAVKKINEEEQKVIAETEVIETKSYNERIKAVLGFVGSLNSALSDFANFAIKMVDDIDLISGKTVTTYENQVKNAQAYSDTIKILYGEHSTQYAESSLKVAESKKNLVEAEGAASMASLNMAMMVADIMQKVAAAINDMLVETNTAIIEAYDTLANVMGDYYDTLIQVNADSLDAQLEDFKGSYAERERIIDEHYAKQTEYAEAKELIEYQAAYTKLTLENDSKMKKDMTASAKKQMGEIVAGMYEQQALEEEYRIKKLQREIETAEEVKNRKIQALEDELDAYVAAKEEEIKKAEDARDAQIDSIKNQLDAAKDAYEQQTNAVKSAYGEQLSALKEKESQEKASLQATYDFKRNLLEQSKSDETEAIVVVDRLRDEALERYRIAEVNRLTATRNRILATLTDEGEREAITNAYAKKIEDVHAEVETAKLDKSKGVSLATKQLNQEAKDGAVTLKKQEKTEIGKLDDDYQTKFTNLAKDRDAKLEEIKNDYIKRETDLKATITQLQSQMAVTIKGLEDEITAKKQDASMQKANAEKDYANFVLSANKQIMQSQIQMAIAQIRAEIAMLQGKRNIFNRGKIDAAVGDLEGSIRDLEALMGGGTVIANVPDDWTTGIKNEFISQRKAAKTPFRADNLEAVGEAYDKSGNQIALTYTDEDRTFTAYDKAGNSFTIRNATGYASATGETFKDGTPYLELNGNPSGVDTIPGWVKGKGIAHFDEGERIVSRKMNALLGGREVSNDELVAKTIFADRILQRTAMKFDTLLAPLPASMLNGATGGNNGQWEQIANKIVDAVNKPNININASPYGLTVEEIGRNRQHRTYYKNTPFSKLTP